MIARGRWQPRDGHGLYSRRPIPGDVIALDWKAWRVLEVRSELGVPLPDPPRGVQPFEPYRLIVVPVDLLTGEWGPHHIMDVKRDTHFDVLEEHFPICARCHELRPCREEYNDAQVRYALEELARYDSPGCPACLEPITSRQKSVTLPNVINPAGGTVTFHAGRWQCLRSAGNYEKRVLEAGAIAKLTLSCNGFLIRHRDGTTECQGEDQCPGPDVDHRRFMECQHYSHGCPRLECNLGV